MTGRRRPWSRQAITQTLAAMRAAGRDLSPRTLNRENQGLYLAAIRTFGSYREALIAAGIDPAMVMTFPTKRRWSRKAILAAIRETYDAGVRPTTKALMERYSSGIYEAVVREFGSWEAALSAAGVTPDWPYVRWTPDLVLSALAQLRDQGCDMRSEAVERHHSGLVAAARRLFGGYRIALAAVDAVPAWQAGRRLPPGFWANDRNVRAVFRYVLGQEGISLEEAPKVCRRRWFEEHRLGGMLRHRFRNSPALFFRSMYPEVAGLANLPELPKAKDLQAVVLMEAGFHQAATKNPHRFSARVRGLEWVKR